MMTMLLLLAAGLASASLVAPAPVATADIFTAGEKNEKGFAVFGFRIPGFVAAKNTLVVLAEARKYSCSDAGAHDLVAKRSTDQGKSWSALQTVVDPAAVWGAQEGGPKGGAVYDPTPVFDEASGKIHVVFSFVPSRYMSRPPISQAFQLWEVTSPDLGLSWTPPRNLSSILPGDSEAQWCVRTAGGGGNGIQLAHGPKAGRLIVPGYHTFCPVPPAPSPPLPGPPDPSCTVQKAQKVADAWCNRPNICPAKPGPLVARRSGGATSPAVEWRCYSPSCLTPDKRHYLNASGCKQYCTEPRQLENIMKHCIAPAGPAPGAHSGFMSHVLTSDATDASGQRTWKLSGSFLPGSGEGSLAEIGANKPGELLFIARRTSATHCTDPPAAHCVGAIRSFDSGDQWDESSAKDVGALLDPTCKNTVAAVGLPTAASNRSAGGGGGNLLVHAGSHSAKARTNVSAIFSHDGGQTWGGDGDAVMVCAAPKIGGYTTVQPVGETLVGVVFEHSQGSCSIAIGVLGVPVGAL